MDKIKKTFQPKNSSWDEYSKKGGLQTVIDVNDKKGKKNKFIDTLNKTAILNVCEFNKDTVVLDFGCGTGRISKFISPMVKKVIGIDITEGMVKVAEKENNGDNIEYFVFDGQNINLPSNSIDLIISVYVLQFVVNTDYFKETLKEFSRILKPSGKLLFIEQVSYQANNKPLSGKSATGKSSTKNNYLRSVDKFFKLENEFPIRIYNISSPFLMKIIEFFPESLYPKLALFMLGNNKNKSFKNLKKYRYFDWLYYGTINK